MNKRGFRLKLMKVLINYVSLIFIRLDLKLFSIKQFKLMSFYLINSINKFFNFLIIRNDQLHIYLHKSKLLNLTFFLKNSIFFSCNQLVDFTVTDRLEYMKNFNRWEYIYVLLS